MISTNTHFIPKTAFITFVLWQFATSLFAQATWYKTLPSVRKQIPVTIEPAGDGNYWLLTNYEYAYPDSIDIRLMKINLDGQVLNTISIPKAWAFGLTVFQDGSVAIAGQKTNGGILTPDFFAVKLNPAGVEEWQLNYATGTRGYACVVASDGSGGYFVGGARDWGEKSLLVKLSGTGAIQWTKDYVVEESCEIQHILFEGNKLILIGRYKTLDPEEGPFILGANKNTGAELWRTKRDIGRFEHPGFTYKRTPFIRVEQGANDEIHLVQPGLNQFNPGSAYFRFDPNGIELQKLSMNKMYDFYRYPMDLVIENNGDMVFAGASGIDPIEPLFPYLEKRSAHGEIIWSKQMPIEGQLTAMVAVPGGGYLACGINDGSLSNQGQIIRTLLVRFDSTGNARPCRIQGRVVLEQDGNCIGAPNDPALPNWPLVLDGSIYVNTDASGFYSVDVLPGSHLLQLKANTSLYSVCQSSFDVTADLANPIKTLDFLVNKKAGCPYLEVGLTHSSLSACDTSTYYLSWQNRGNAAAFDVKIKLKLDPNLSLVNAGAPFNTVSSTEFVFPVGLVETGEMATIPFRVRLDCNAEPFSTHCIEAEIEPVSFCWTQQPNWDGAQLEVKGECLGDIIRFSAKNIGNAPLVTPADYRLYVDGALMEDGVLSPAPGQTTVLDYPAEGRTLMLETNQVNNFPIPAFPGATVEGCGVAANGFFSTGFVRMFNRHDVEPWKSHSCVEASGVKQLDKLHEMTKGYGNWQWITTEKMPLEFALDLVNHSDASAHQVSIYLYPSMQFELSSFEPVAWSHPFQTKITSDGMIELYAQNIDVLPGAAFQLRFRLMNKSQSALNDAFIGIGAEAFFDNSAQLELVDAFYNVKQNFIANTITPSSTDPAVQLFGRGNAFEYPRGLVQSPDGDISVLGITSTFDEGQSILVTRTDSTGIGKWQKQFRFAAGGHRPATIVALPDNSLMIGGAFDETPLGYNGDVFSFIARIDQDGNLLWQRQWKSGIGVTIYNALLAPDGNVLFVENGQGGQNPFSLLKISPDNQIIFDKPLLIDRLEDVSLKYDESGRLYVLGKADFWSQHDYTIANLDDNGDVLYFNEFVKPANGYPTFRDFTPTADKGILMIGDDLDFDTLTSDYVNFFVAAKFDSLFNLEWYKKYPIPGLSEIAGVVNSGIAFFLSGRYLSQDFSIQEAFIMKLDSNGNLVWFKPYAINADEYGTNLITGQNHRIWMLAQTQAVDWLYNLQFALIKASDPDVLVHAEENPEKQIAQLQISPVPANREIRVRTGLGESPAPSALFRIFNASGQVLTQGTWRTDMSIPVSDLPNGAYHLQLETGGAIVGTGKFLVVH